MIDVKYEKHSVFKLNMPTTCPDIPDDILDPIKTWDNKLNYDKTAKKLANLFHKNFNSISNSKISQSIIDLNKLQDIKLGGPEHN